MISDPPLLAPESVSTSSLAMYNSLVGNTHSSLVSSATSTAAAPTVSLLSSSFHNSLDALSSMPFSTCSTPSPPPTPSSPSLAVFSPPLPPLADSLISTTTATTTATATATAATGVTTKKTGRATKNAPMATETSRQKNKTASAAILKSTLKKQISKEKPSQPSISQTSFDKDFVHQLLTSYPPIEWRNPSLEINHHSEFPLKLVASVSHQDAGSIYSISLSQDGVLIASASTLGSLCIWDSSSLQQIAEIRDREEPNIIDYYCVQFTPNSQYVLAGGKIKNRKHWSFNDNDNHILPCSVKLFDITTGNVVTTLSGPLEEVLSITCVTYKGENYVVCTSEDGHIWKWLMTSDWSAKISSGTKLKDEKSCMAFSVAFIPQTGNRYLLAACDDSLLLFDFETGHLLQTFKELNSSYCDYVTEVPYECLAGEDSSNQAYFLTRGCEILDAENNSVASKPNKCVLHKLIFPSKANEEFQLETVHEFSHEDYHSNSWLIRAGCNSNYIGAPTVNGKVFIWSLLGGDPLAILSEHRDHEVRQVLFHPFQKRLYTCGDDSSIKLYEANTDQNNTHVPTDSLPSISLQKKVNRKTR